MGSGGSFTGMFVSAGRGGELVLWFGMAAGPFQGRPSMQHTGQGSWEQAPRCYGQGQGEPSLVGGGRTRAGRPEDSQLGEACWEVVNPAGQGALRFPLSLEPRHGPLREPAQRLGSLGLEARPGRMDPPPGQEHPSPWTAACPGKGGGRRERPNLYHEEGPWTGPLLLWREWCLLLTCVPS